MLLPIYIAIGALAIRPGALFLLFRTRSVILISSTVVAIMRISPLLPSILIEKVVLAIILLSLLPILLTLLRLTAMKTAIFTVVGPRVLFMRLIICLEATSGAASGTTATSLRACTPLLSVLVPHCIILFFDILVRKYIVSCGDILKFVLVARFALCSIGMVLLCQLVELTLDLCLACSTLHAQFPIVINIWVEVTLRCEATPCCSYDCGLYGGRIESEGARRRKPILA